jgi:hypothetical protein
MDIPLFPSTGGAPKSRDEVRIEQLEITPYPDRFRIHIHLVVTPFLERPNLLLVAHTEDDRVVSELSVIETMHHDMEFTMHLRGVDDPTGMYTLSVDLFYETRQPTQDSTVETFTIPPLQDDDVSLVD